MKAQRERPEGKVLGMTPTMVLIQTDDVTHYIINLVSASHMGFFLFFLDILMNSNEFFIGVMQIKQTSFVLNVCYFIKAWFNLI